MYDLKGKVAVITGAGRERGFGQAIAKRFAVEGAKLVISDIGHRFANFPEYPLGTTEELAQRAAEIKALGAEVLPLVVDISERADVENMVEQAVKRFGEINILVNNAGVGIKLAPSLEWTVEEWDKVFAVNVRGTWLCCKAVGKQMIQQGKGGKIINMSSQSARSGEKLQPAYNASKAAILNYSQSLAYELAPYKINVNTVCPGIMDTQLTEIRLQALYQEMKPPIPFEAFKLKAAKDSRIPLGRMGTADEVASLVSFLASSESEYITGQAININGGQVMA